MNALLLAASALLAMQSAPHAHHQAGAPAGTINFATSCNAAAQGHFNQGVAWLHSFEYEEAARAFGQAAAADPACAMSQWGLAMSSYHPLWAPPTPAELERGRAAIEQAARLGAPTARERDYVASLSVFYADAGRADHRTRSFAYAAAMERLHRTYPQDREAAVFYALALIATGTMEQDGRFVRETRAAAILNAVMAEQPDHPGVAHYLIHSFDYPPLAHLALPAARRYAGIAPASAHAQHMPSHIFTRLGLWQDAIRSNLAAHAAAQSYARAQHMPGVWDEQLHAMDYLAYAYLQAAQDDDARGVIRELNGLGRVDPPNFKVAFAATAIPARFALERRQWREAAALTLPANIAIPWPRFRWAEAQIHFARAVGAARTGNIAQARSEVAIFAEIRQALTASPGEYDWGIQVEIERQIAAGWLAGAEGRRDDALRILRAAADLDDETEKHPVTPGSVMPAREQLGEMLLELRRPREALAEFETALRRAPNRLTALYGAARAARLSGDRRKARLHYGQMLEGSRSRNRERPELQEARAYLATNARR
jgi:tetratricopeptide (TPR) repeat protein